MKMTYDRSNLAIIIPAYKATFLRAALDSIVAQTCQDFTLYIGDDCSPHQLGAIVDEYRDKINLIYQRFETNLGGKNLVAQWERCIAMSQDEPYIWLFSDDDVLESECVEAFLSLPKEKQDNYVVHFNIHQIDEKGKILKTPVKYPERMTAKEYLDAKLFQKGIISYVVEFVFPRWIYEKTGGFQNYDLAWGSDFITWLKFAEACKGIYTINNNNAHVRWRSSSENISPDKSRDTQIRKINSQIKVAQYIQEYLQRNDYKHSFRYVKFVFGDVQRSLNSFTCRDIKVLCQEFRKDIGWPILTALAEMILIFQKNSKKVKDYDNRLYNWGL